jgi:hypothetical protein
MNGEVLSWSNKRTVASRMKGASIDTCQDAAGPREA